MRKLLRNIRDRLKKWTRAGKAAEPALEPDSPRTPATEPLAGSSAEQEAASDEATVSDGKKRRRSRRRGPRKTDEAPAAAPAGELAADWDPALFDVTPMEGKTRFHDFSLAPAILHGICEAGFQYCTPIQAETLRDSLAGRDIVGRAQTGTGKTAAFLITLFQRLLTEGVERDPAGPPRALVLAPTRELVMQIAKDAAALGSYLPLKVLAVFGGMEFQAQQRQLEEGGVDVIVATPGRLIDFSRRRMVRLDAVGMLVIDEADRMLDMGFIPDVRRIVAHLPREGKRQTMFYSATITDEVKRLAFQWTHDPVHVDIEPEQVAVETVDQVVYLATSEEKYAILYNLIQQGNLERVMVFTNRRDETRRLTERLAGSGISCAMLSGDVAQEKRVRTLEQFRGGKIRVLVATDVAGRGVHIDGVSHVVNFHLPHNPEDFVHRIGRTGRAGASGTAVSFADEEDAFYIPDIEQYIGRPLTCVHPEDDLLTPPPEKPRPEGQGGERRGRRPQGGRSHGSGGRGRSGGGRSGGRPRGKGRTGSA